MLPADQCDFCGSQEELVSCCWPGKQFVVAAYWRLVVGDRVKRFVQPGGSERPPAIVEEIRQIGVYYLIVLRIGKRLKSIQVQGPSFVRVERDGLCGRRACFRHLREVGEGKNYCMEHWKAWETSAPFGFEHAGVEAPALAGQAAASREDAGLGG